ncbi:hypothetical protein ANCDUO_00196 [Ancylostoma duodenale]|uniref:Uncharacterized protein n=1 Tax=Ancylostoma duodenale TaxID=51022 RepID=A0A0C2H6H1_9BILA|nr:hypothetical protein ANCDUO_00196 [Ancylostoma duodenale]
MKITTEAYVCIKAITLLHYNKNSDWTGGNQLDRSLFIRKVTLIQDQFVKALQIHLIQNEEAARLSDILTWNESERNLYGYLNNSVKVVANAPQRVVGSTPFEDVSFATLLQNIQTFATPLLNSVLEQCKNELHS